MSRAPIHATRRVRLGTLQWEPAGRGPRRRRAADRGHAAHHRLDEPLRGDVPDAAERRRPTTAFGSSAPAGSCRSQATRRWGRAPPGSTPAGCRSEATGRPGVRRRAARSAPRVIDSLRGAPDDPSWAGRRGSLADGSTSSASTDRGQVASSTRVDRQRPGLDGDLLASAQAVLDVRLPTVPSPGSMSDSSGSIHPAASPPSRCVRSSSMPSGAMREDPVTGSLNASVAQWLTESGRLIVPYVAAQGRRSGVAAESMSTLPTANSGSAVAPES